MVFPEAREQISAELAFRDDFGRWATRSIARKFASGDQYHDRREPARCDLSCCLNAPYARHSSVHQDQVGAKALGLLDALFA
ncbi:MAG TPA: hypothetical protein VIX82_08070 [Solirubrobacteraceae bacterium]